MNFRVVTVAREYGSGGAAIAANLAGLLGWKLLDKDLLCEISKRAQAPVAEVAAFDEQVDPWLHRITRPLWGMEVDGVIPVAPVEIYDAERGATVARRVIEEAHREGNCVIVGRGSQCALKGQADVFHVYVYAPWADRLARIEKELAAGADVAAVVAERESQRAEYVRRYFGANRTDPHLYGLMLNTHRIAPEAAARLVRDAMEAAG